MLTAWEFDSAPTVGVGLAGLLYLMALRGLRSAHPERASRARAGKSRGHPAAFAVGLLVLLVAIDGPPDSLSDSSFSAHMVQHLLIQLVAAPLLLLGAPLTLLLQANPRWLPRRTLARALRSRPVGVVSHPVVAFTLFAAVMVGSHLTPIYNLALEREWVHQVEHVIYLCTALLFWWPAIGVDPGPHRLAHPGRVLYLLLIMPVMAFLGVAIISTGRVLYPYYAAHPPPWEATPLSDQGLAGALMWISGMLIITPALAVAVLRWLDQDALEQARRETVRPVGGRRLSDAAVRLADPSFEE
jgi:cytochrome c oxidase assembly factor CtaG